MLLHDLLIPHRLIIEAGDIHLVRQFVLDGGSPIVERRCRWPRRVFLMEQAREPLGFLPAIGAPLFGNLVADAVHNDAGMIAIAPHHIAQIALRPFVEILRVAVRNLGDAPHVERFIHHHQAHPVA